MIIVERISDVQQLEDLEPRTLLCLESSKQHKCLSNLLLNHALVYTERSHLSLNSISTKANDSDPACSLGSPSSLLESQPHHMNGKLYHNLTFCVLVIIIINI